MKTVVVFASRYGSTASAASSLAQRLNADLVDLGKAKPDLDRYDAVVIGGPILAGSLPANVKKFCTDNQTVLLGKRIGLFICCAREGKEAQEQLVAAFSSELCAHAAVSAVLGGTVIVEKHNFLIRTLLKKVGMTESFSRVDEEAIVSLVGAFTA